MLGLPGAGVSVAFEVSRELVRSVPGTGQCPAVTVRADDPAVEAGWGHPAAAGRNAIVVGVQEPAAAADPLLEFAFTTAELHGTRVHAVRALAPVDPRTVGERARLTARPAPWRDKFPDVPVVEQVTSGPAAQVLLSAATHSQLTVVGRRRHPSRPAWKLGPVAHATLHHVPGPVAVVPHD